MHTNEAAHTAADLAHSKAKTEWHNKHAAVVAAHSKAKTEWESKHAAEPTESKHTWRRFTKKNSAHTHYQEKKRRASRKAAGTA